MALRRSVLSAGLGLISLAAVAGVYLVPASGQESPGGVHIGHKAVTRFLVSAEHIEQTALAQYDQLKHEAEAQHALLANLDPRVERVRKIAKAILPHTMKFNERAKDWDWEINVFSSRQINAFCMPGGKIAVFSGLIDQLKLTDDELAMVVGHKISHALREHARSRAGKEEITAYGALAISVLIGNGAGDLTRIAGGLLNLRFSRGDEVEADLIGMELAARAGYDPRAGLSLWEKMTEISKGAPPQWLSTHPSGPFREKAIRDNLKDVLPLYEEAKARKG